MEPDADFDENKVDGYCDNDAGESDAQLDLSDDELVKGQCAIETKCL